MMTTTSIFSTTHLTESAYVSFLIQYATENQFAVAVWRLPNDSVKHLIISRKIKSLHRDALLEELEMGFIFAPFDLDKSRVFLPADFKFSFSNNTIVPPANPIEVTSHAWLNEQLKRSNPESPVKYHVTHTPSHDQDVSYEELVRNGIEEIEKGTFEKVVPSRKKVVDLPADFDVVPAFEKICVSNPNALVSFVSTPETGTWLGATPETLVSVENNAIFKTVALAGTKPFEEGVNLKSVTWTQKEIEEQALVERYIISCFKRIRVREYDEHGPKTLVAGNVLHLKSDFMVDMKAINFPQLGSVMLQLLHPTSAVCGMPLSPALEFLKKKEGYDREYYSGFLGPVNVNDTIHIFVNIRCIKLLDSKAIAYAGAGVTIDSIPRQEWEETEFKFNTILKVIER